ncbi:hypothetical protein EYF80_030344 [Liparis tanakae]|uniref:Uncharacterized protein n=1 Tax=Liparis tanakae TaxID=230148 RepID=A0A4Z2H0Y8_9TELE|nr:hypothetical protein EYF80_030344 [Liparis tanakae]
MPEGQSLRKPLYHCLSSASLNSVLLVRSSRTSGASLLLCFPMMLHLSLGVALTWSASDWRVQKPKNYKFKKGKRSHNATGVQSSIGGVLYLVAVTVSSHQADEAVPLSLILREIEGERGER